jgi:NDP-sugar pyrophosphorylase family protein
MPEQSVLPSDCLGPAYGHCRLRYVDQPEPAGQGDAILRGAALLGDTFLVVQPESINAGEIATELLAAWRKDDFVMLAGQQRGDYQLYAVVEALQDRVISIIEKPATAETSDPLCSMGLYLCSQEFTSCLTEAAPGPTSMITAIELAAKVGKAGIMQTRNEFLPLKYPGHLWNIARYLGLADAPVISPADGSARFGDPGRCIVSTGCDLGQVWLDNVIMGENVVIGSGTRTIGDRSWNDLDAVAIGENTTIGSDVRLQPGVRIGAGATVTSGVIVGGDVPDDAVI